MHACNSVPNALALVLVWFWLAASTEVVRTLDGVCVPVLINNLALEHPVKLRSAAFFFNLF
jgi:hypothetical protein